MFDHQSCGILALNRGSAWSIGKCVIGAKTNGSPLILLVQVDIFNRCESIAHAHNSFTNNYASLKSVCEYIVMNRFKKLRLVVQVLRSILKRLRFALGMNWNGFV